MTAVEVVRCILILMRLLERTIVDWKSFDPNQEIELLPETYDEILALAKLKEALPEGK